MRRIKIPRRRASNGYVNACISGADREASLATLRESRGSMRCLPRSQLVGSLTAVCTSSSLSIGRSKPVPFRLLLNGWWMSIIAVSVRALRLPMLRTWYCIVGMSPRWPRRAPCNISARWKLYGVWPCEGLSCYRRHTGRSGMRRRLVSRLAASLSFMPPLPVRFCLVRGGEWRYSCLDTTRRPIVLKSWCRGMPCWSRCR